MGSSKPVPCRRETLLSFLCLYPLECVVGAGDLEVALGSLGAFPPPPPPRPPHGVSGAEWESAGLLQEDGSDGKANYRPSILGLLHIMPLKIKSMLRQLAVGEF